MSSDWYANLESTASAWRVRVAIDGVGSADGQWHFTTNQTAAANADTHKPWLLEVPSILSERVDIAGGIPEAGSCTLQILDVDDTLTSSWRTEADAYTLITEDVDATETEIEVHRATDLDGLVVWIGSEAMLVTAIATSPERITVTRGYLGTEAVAHFDGDPLYLYVPYLEGRRFSVYLEPLEPYDAEQARLVGTYLIDRISWTQDTNAWILEGVSQQRYLDRQAPIAPRVATTVGKVPAGIVLMDTTQTTINALWPDALAHMQIESEIVQVWDETRYYFPTTSPQPLSSKWELRLRGVFETKEDEIAAKTQVRQVFLAGRDLRYSPGPSPSTSRSSGTWTAATHWVDLLLILLLSSADEADGLELTNRRTTGSDWSRSNFSSLPPGYGAGIPHTLIDWASWEAVRARTSAYTLPYFAYGAETQPFAELIGEQFLQPMGAYMAFESGVLKLQLTRVPMVEESTTLNIDADQILRREVASGHYLPELGMKRERLQGIGAVVYELGPQKTPVTFRNGDWGRTYGQRGWYGATEPTLRIRVPGASPEDADLWGQRAAARLYRHHRPAITLDMQLDAGMIEAAAVGAVAALTLLELPNPLTGTRGWSGERCEIIEREITTNPGRDGGDGVAVRVVARRHGVSSRIGRIGPAAKIVSVSGDTATIEENRFTVVDGALDTLPQSDGYSFLEDDAVILVNADGSVVNSTPQVVLSTLSNELELDGDFSGDLAAGLYLVYANADDATTTQVTRYVYLSDQADQTPGSLDRQAWRWGEP